MLLSKILYIGLLIAKAFIGNAYDFEVPTIEGDLQPLSVYQSKKILVISLPIVENAETNDLLSDLDSLANAYSGKLVVIGTPSVEDGYTSEMKTQLHQWYRSKLGSKIVITKGLYTRKTSGELQHVLFKWLTRTEQNETFDQDVNGPGYKFLINNTGSLTAVLIPQTRINGTTLKNLLDQ